MLRSLVVLIDDDDEDVRLITELSLRMDPGITIRSVGTAFAALELLRDGYRPDLLLSDYRMPGMTGLELVDAVRRLPDLMTLKIVLITAAVDAETLREMHRAGLISVVTKPFDPVTLAPRIRELAFADS